VQSVVTTAATRAQAGGRRRGVAAVSRFFRAWPTLAAALIYLVLSVLMVGQGLLPGRTLSGSDFLLSSVPWQSSKPASVPGLGTNFELADAADVFQPFLQHTRAQLPGVPLWDPFLMAGRPLLADMQSATFSPFSLPSYVLPFWKSLAVAAILKLFVAALGTFVLARALRMRFGGALLSGVVFAFGTFYVTWLAWPLSSVYAFIPWALAATELLVRRPSRLTFAGLAAVVGLQFLGGFPEASFHLVFATVVFFLFRVLLLHRREPRRVLRTGGLFVGALALGGALAAVVLAPFLEFLVHSGDLSQRAHVAAGYWPRKYLGALFLHDYWGRPTQVDLAAFMQVRGWYAGAATLILAAAALLLRLTAERIAVVVFALFCACMVLGIPPVFGIVSALPLFDVAHNERMLIYVLLSLALLAGWGLDEICESRIPSPRSRRAVLGVGALIVCVPIVWMVAAGTLNLRRLGSGLEVAWGFAHPPPPIGVNVAGSVTAAIVRDSALEIWLPLAGAALALVALRLRRSRPLAAGALVALTVLLLAADLFRANMGYNPAIRESTAAPPMTGAIRYLRSRRPNRFIGVSTQLLSQPLPADLAVTFGLYDARGYDFPVEKHFDALWRRSVAPGVGAFTQPEEFAGATPASLRALDLLSVSDLLVGPLQAIRFPVHGPGIKIAYKGHDGVIYSNSRALPRVFVVDRQRTVAGDRAALAAVTAPGFDRRAVAITEAPLPGLPQAGAGSDARPVAGASTRLVSYEPERVVIDANTPVRGELILTDDFYPGWTATVDGRSVAVQRVDYLLRGVALGPGRHVVGFRYRPTSWRIGWIVSVSAVAVLLGLVASRALARRRVP
jgi:hypothetical protein